MKLLFPIKKSELKLFVPISLLMLLILFNTSIFKTLKDTLMIADKNSGAEVVNFLKIFIVVPLSFLFVFLYSKACNWVDNRVIFYYVIGFFTLFFLIFTLYLYPNKELLHPSPDHIEYLKLLYPRLKWVMPIYGLWTYSLFYSFADLWCSMCLSLLFWQFANQIVSKEDSRRFYGSFAIIGYLGLIFAGYTVKTIFHLERSSVKLNRNIIHDSLFDSQLKWILFITVICNICIIGLYFLITKYVAHDNVKYTVKKSKLSLMSSFKVIFKQKQVMYIMLLVFCYNFSINIVETTWKAQLRKFAYNKSNFILYIGTINQIVGYTTIALGFLSNILFQRYSWLSCAMITPIFAGFTSLLFLTFIGIQYYGIKYIFGISIIAICVFVGIAHNVLSKSGKYVFFDQTKEMAYMSLSDEIKTKGKAAVDVAGSRLSKSLSGQVQALLLILIPNSSQLKIFPYLGIILCFIFLLWFWSLRKLSQTMINVNK
ncbi:Npt1/Npt2 family nucleotide transporter [Candidatus Cytomitobacter primus]|nr:Npt1/Npt2 family nucleotide transporter [Candidatus Cytomitobacter primus]